MADQNEMSKMSEPHESVLLADASAKKATQAPDTDLGIETECLLTICTHQPFHTELYLPADPEKAFADIKGTEPIYFEAHRLMEVVPASHLIQNLAKPYINLNHHGVGPKGVKDIASAMVRRGVTGLVNTWCSAKVNPPQLLTARYGL